jgi:hypothetical protein
MYFRMTSGTRLMAILGSAAHLPCNITPPVIGSVFSIVSLPLSLIIDLTYLRALCNGNSVYIFFLWE